MAEKPRQLALDLPVEARYEAEDFVTSACNEKAQGYLEAWPAWPDRVAVLYGAAGSGKSHLAAIWARRTGASFITREGLTRAAAPGFLAAGAAVFEDPDRAPPDEAAFFHLLNTARERQASLLITARQPAARWEVRTPDLASRLKLAPAVGLDPPDDALIRVVLVKHFIDRQIQVDTRLVEYVAMRVERSFEGCRAAVEAMDREALARGGKITRAIAAAALGMEDTPE